MEARQMQLVAGPFYHNSPFCCAHYGLFEDHTVIVMERFDARRAADLIERYRVNFVFMAPTMMSRVARLTDADRRDFSSIEVLYHTAAPCPAWLKRRWIDLLGPTHVYEAFGAAEDAGVVTIRGDEWLDHPGSLGRGYNTKLVILDDDGLPVKTGEVGEIFMRYADSVTPNYYYIGAPPAKATADGCVSVGDMGWVDEDGYLYLADRRVDLIISGGENIYPAEVEAAISEHPAVWDVAVIGLADPEWGKRVHAVIQPINPSTAPDNDELREHCLARLARYKVPKSFEVVDQLPRDQSGKIRRLAMVQERAKAQT
jgi:bile acid-coenzyme A ligase